MTPFEQGYVYTMKCAGMWDRAVAAWNAPDTLRAAHHARIDAHTRDMGLRMMNKFRPSEHNIFTGEYMPEYAEQWNARMAPKYQELNELVEEALRLEEVGSAAMQDRNRAGLVLGGAALTGGVAAAAHAANERRNQKGIFGMGWG
jgi:hypothetical protein